MLDYRSVDHRQFQQVLKNSYPDVQRSKDGQVFWKGTDFKTYPLKIHDVKKNLPLEKNNGTPKSSILIGFSIVNHPFWEFSPYFGENPTSFFF